MAERVPSRIIIGALAEMYDLTPEEVMGSRVAQAIEARWLAIAFMREHNQMSWPEIMRAFGKTSHSTVHNAYHTWKLRRSSGEQGEEMQRVASFLEVTLADEQGHVRFDLPYPPSANRYWRHNQGRTHRSNEAKAYISEVKYLLGDHLPVIPGRVRIKAFPPDRRKRDLDNLLKIPLDALTQSGFWEDDSLIREITIGWGEPDKDRSRLQMEVSLRRPGD